MNASDYSRSGLVAAVVLGAVLAGAAPVSAELVLYWPMDELSWTGAPGEVSDLSGKGNDGQRYYNANTVAGGKFGRAGSFDGSGDRVEVAAGRSLQLGSNGTVSVWVNFDSLPSGTRAIAAAYWYKDSFLFRQADDDFTGYWKSGGPLPGLTSNNVFSTGTWYHLVLTNKAGTVTAYLDGSPLGTNAEGPNAFAPSYVSAGGTRESGAWTIYGRVDDFAVFNTALRQRRVQELANGAATPLTVPNRPTSGYQAAVNALGPVAYWRLDEGPGSPTAYDTTDNQLDGQVNAGTLGQPAYNHTMGKAVDLSPGAGNPYVDVGNPAELPEGDMSVVFWMNSRANDKSIITKGQSRATQSLRDWDIFGNGTNLIFLGSTGTATAFLAQTPYPSLNDWHQVVATWDGTTSADGVKLYVDGSLAAQATANGSLNDTHNLFLGGSGIWRYDGLLDEVALYDYALSLAQVQALYSARIPEPSTFLLSALGLLGMAFVGWRRRRKRVAQA